jgi:hypothetical protein
MSIFMLRDDFVAIGLGMGFREVAAEDAWLLYAEYEGTARDFFREHKEDRPHWFAAPAAASNSEHPVFYSVDEQVVYHREHGEAELRELLAKSGLKPGQVKPGAKEGTADIKGANNPYSDEFLKSHTPAERDARITSLIKSGGTALAASIARAAGKNVMNQKL